MSFFNKCLYYIIELHNATKTKKFWLFSIVVFLSNVVTGIILAVILVSLNASDELWEIIVIPAIMFVSAFVYWLFYGKQQYIRYLKRKARKQEAKI